MSQEELSKLEAESAELEQKLRDLNARKFELRKREAEERAKKEQEELLRKPIEIKVVSISGSLLFTESDYRPDLTETWKQIPGRIWKGYSYNQIGRNAVPAANWEEAEKTLLELPYISIVWNEGVKERFDWLFNAPPWEIDIVGEDTVTATPGPNMAYSTIGSFPGAAWAYGKHGQHYYTLPVSEGWRIPEALKNVEGVVYSDTAQAVILNQVSLRTQIDQIAISHDSDWMKDFEFANGKSLRPFQKVFGEFTKAVGGRIILGDDTGLGKTVEAIAWVLYQRISNPQYQGIFSVPANSTANWRREIKDWAGIEPYVCIDGKPNEYDAKKIIIDRVPFVLISQDTMSAYRIIDRETKEQITKKEFKLLKLQGLENTVDLIYPWVELFSLSNPDLFVVDEAHQVKNPKAHRTKATFKFANMQENIHLFAMTATPLLNRMEELGTILRLVKPKQFRSHEEFKRNYTVDGRQALNVKELHKMMRTFFLRRKKSDVYKDIPQINRIHRFYDLSDDAKERYDEVLTGFYTELAEFDPTGMGGNNMQVMSLLAQITRLTQICAADAARNFTPDLAVEISDSFGDEAGKKKVLIYTNFKGTAFAIARRLGNEAVCTVEHSPSGFHSMNANRRDELFESVRNRDDIKFIVTTSAAKQGHNLEFCWATIFNDPWWTPAWHYQSEGRCIRLSNPHSIDSYFVVADTEVISMKFEMLEEKLKLFEEAIEGVESEREISGSIGMELLKKLKESMWSRKGK